MVLELEYDETGNLQIKEGSATYSYIGESIQYGTLNFSEDAEGVYRVSHENCGVGADRSIAPICFTNTYTAPDPDPMPDEPMIDLIPAVLSKNTGMLNKTDHMAYVIGYPDGSIHPNGQITRAEVAAIAARFDESQSGRSATFRDVIGHWAAKEIGIAYENEWIAGYPDGSFQPDQKITRAEAMAMINRMLGRKPESTSDLFPGMNTWTDNMDPSKWYYLDVQEATNSHTYTRKTFGGELWRQMLPAPDWFSYER